MEQLDWMHELAQIKWAIASLAQVFPPGSYDKENAQNAARGIQARLDWCIEQAKAERAKAEPAKK